MVVKGTIVDYLPMVEPSRVVAVIGKTKVNWYLVNLKVQKEVPSSEVDRLVMVVVTMVASSEVK